MRVCRGRLRCNGNRIRKVELNESTDKAGIAMELAETVRIGGKLAVVIGFLSLNLIFSNSVTYYYGYSNAPFGVPATSDPFAKQNVSFTPQVPMVSSPTQSLNYAGSVPSSAATPSYSLLANVYGYSTPATASTPTYSAQGGPSYYTPSYSSPSYSAPTVITNTVPTVTNTSPTTVSAPTNGSSSYYSPSFYSPSYVSSPVSSPTVSNTTPVAAPVYYTTLYANSVPTFNYWSSQAVNSSVNPVVGNQISSGVKPVGGYPGQILGPVTTIGAPEPGTLLMLSAGLALVFLKLRRR